MQAVSLRVLTWAFDQAPTADAFEQAVLLAIADRCNDAGDESYQSIPTIARRARLKERAVYNIIERLKRRGILSVQKGASPRRTNSYTIRMDPCMGCTPALDAPLHEMQVDPAPDAGIPLHRMQVDPAPDAPDPSLIRPLIQKDDPEIDRDDLVLSSESRSSSLSDRFDAFWKQYPAKKAKGAALKAWQKLKPSPELTDDMLAAIERQRTCRQWRDGFIPNPATWLNQERWLDEDVPIGTPTGRTGAPVNGSKYAGIVQRDKEPSS